MCCVPSRSEYGVSMGGSMTSNSKAKVTLFLDTSGYDERVGPSYHSWCERKVSKVHTYCDLSWDPSLNANLNDYHEYHQSSCLESSSSINGSHYMHLKKTLYNWLPCMSIACHLLKYSNDRM